MTDMTIPAWLQFPTPEFEKDCPERWMAFRQKHWQAFLQHGLPTSKNERWKYADLSWLAAQTFSLATRLSEHDHQTEVICSTIAKLREQHRDHIFLVFVNGFFMPLFSDLKRLPSDVIACDIQQALKHHAHLVDAHCKAQSDVSAHPFASLNAARCMDGLFFYLPDNQVLTAPLHLLFIACGNEAFVAHPHQIMMIGNNSKLTLIEDYVSLSAQHYMMNIATHIIVQKNAQLEQYKIQHESKLAMHIAATFIQQYEQSHVTCTQFSSGGKFARDDLHITLQGQGAECRTGGFYQLNNDYQYIDHHVDILHKAPNTVSDMLYKGIVDKKSRAVFNGRLLVEKDAQKIIAHQANHNLLLSSQAEINSKPELEIYADDVKCKHGATTGQIDQEALFYLCSRGIPHAEAQRILIKGFADEILQRIQCPNMKTRIQEMMSS